MTDTMTRTASILIIRLSAFGDVVMSLPIMQAIRAQHPQAKITLMTTPLFAKFLKDCPFFDHILVVERWPFYKISNWWAFARSLRQFDKVYDLQRNDRTRIFGYLAPARLRAAWIGGKATRHLPLWGDIDGKRVPHLNDTDFSWMKSDISGLGVRAPYALIVAGCAPQHPYKRWPADKFAQVAQSLLEMGLQPVLIGGPAEGDVLDAIKAITPEALNLCGKTSFFDIAELARGARIAIGNDTGPMHLISAIGCPVISLFSGKTRPELSAPRGRVVRTLQGEPIEIITTDAVMDAVRDMLEPC